MPNKYQLTVTINDTGETVSLSGSFQADDVELIKPVP